MRGGKNEKMKSYKISTSKLLSVPANKILNLYFTHNHSNNITLCCSQPLSRKTTNINKTTVLRRFTENRQREEGLWERAELPPVRPHATDASPGRASRCLSITFGHAPPARHDSVPFCHTYFSVHTKPCFKYAQYKYTHTKAI